MKTKTTKRTQEHIHDPLFHKLKLEQPIPTFLWFSSIILSQNPVWQTGNNLRGSQVLLISRTLNFQRQI